MAPPSRELVREEARLPRAAIPLVVGVVAFPFAWYLLGPDESLVIARTDQLARSSAASVHALFEWSGVCSALMTSFLAFVHFGATRANPTMALLAPVFLFAGLLDALHTVASLDLVPTVAHWTTLIPTTWALGRWYTGLALAVSPAIALSRSSEHAANVRVHVLLNVALGIATVGVMYLTSRIPLVPKEFLGERLVRRPADLLGLLLFAFAAVYTMPRFYARFPSLLSHALMLSMVPQVAAQAFMTFGSARLYDAPFFWAHALKVFAYLLPLFGIALDYVAGHQAEQRALRLAEKARLALVEQIKDLTEQYTARQDAEEALLQHVARADLHTRIAVAANQATSFAPSLQELMGEICAYTGWAAGHVFIVREGTPRRLVETGVWYADEPSTFAALRQSRAHLELAPGEGVAGRAWEAGAPIWEAIPVARESMARPTESVPETVQSVLAFPAMVGTRVVGVLEFFLSGREAVATQMVETMTYVGVQFGRAFERLPWTGTSAVA